MRTRITEQLHIEYPVFQGAMAWIADGYLAASVSNAGGLGVIAGGAAPIEVIREEVKKAKSMTDKPFALNIMLLSPNADDVAQLVIDEKIPVVTTGAGSPSKYIQQWKQAGCRFCCAGAPHGASGRRCSHCRGHGVRRTHW